MVENNAPGPVQDIQKRAAQVNTQLRFKKHEEALTLALKLRLHIQSCGFEHPLVEEELVGVEAVIKSLERRRFGYYHYLTGLFIKALYDAFRGQKPDEAPASEAPEPLVQAGSAQPAAPVQQADEPAINPARMAAAQSQTPPPQQQWQAGDDDEQLPPGAPRM
ncbi:MAG: hypothetical protein KC910_04590 [Candidatus Eremiobacteraeota bacterium]|nr:hypothetical protein [Candidatus Eremiobacteraeota bacterium]